MSEAIRILHLRYALEHIQALTEQDDSSVWRIAYEALRDDDIAVVEPNIWTLDELEQELIDR